MADIIGWSVAKRIVVATAVAGTLDILAAIGLTLWYGRQIPDMLRYVASGPIPAAKDMGGAGALLGLLVHFALMALMASAYIVTADRVPTLKTQPLLSGIIYGLITWTAMNLLVVPARFGTLPGTMSILTQLFCHVVLVGVPIAFTARK
jgi:hypothetical protein